MALVFNEWAARYAKDPESFGPILDADGNPVEDYGEQCAECFDRIAREMDEAKQLPFVCRSSQEVNAGDMILTQYGELEVAEVHERREQGVSCIVDGKPKRFLFGYFYVMPKANAGDTDCTITAPKQHEQTAAE